MLRALVIILALTAAPALAQQASGAGRGPEGPWRMQLMGAARYFRNALPAAGTNLPSGGRSAGALVVIAHARRARPGMRRSPAKARRRAGFSSTAWS